MFVCLCWLVCLFVCCDWSVDRSVGWLVVVVTGGGGSGVNDVNNSALLQGEPRVVHVDQEFASCSQRSRSGQPSCECSKTSQKHSFRASSVLQGVWDSKLADGLMDLTSEGAFRAHGVACIL